MHAINITELGQHLPDYLKQVEQGEEFIIIEHGRAIARIIPNLEDNDRGVALKRLEALHGTVIVGDILAPLDEEWVGDADNL